MARIAIEKKLRMASSKHNRQVTQEATDLLYKKVDLIVDKLVTASIDNCLRQQDKRSENKRVDANDVETAYKLLLRNLL